MKKPEGGATPSGSLAGDRPCHPDYLMHRENKQDACSADANLSSRENSCSRRKERSFATIRRARGLSVEQAAIRLGISARRLRQLELSRCPLGAITASRMCRIYGCSLSDLTRPEPTAAPQQPDGDGAVVRPAGI